MGWRLFLSGEKYSHFFRMTKSKDVLNIHMNNWTPMSNNPLRNPATCIHPTIYIFRKSQPMFSLTTFFLTSFCLPLWWCSLSRESPSDDAFMHRYSNTTTRSFHPSYDLKDLERYYRSPILELVGWLHFYFLCQLLCSVAMLSRWLTGMVFPQLLRFFGCYMLPCTIIWFKIHRQWTFIFTCTPTLHYEKTIEKTSQRTPTIERTWGNNSNLSVLT